MKPLNVKIARVLATPAPMQLPVLTVFTELSSMKLVRIALVSKIPHITQQLISASAQLGKGLFANFAPIILSTTKQPMNANATRTLPTHQAAAFATLASDTTNTMILASSVP